ncbi:MAG: hypothetical protein ACKO96_14705, partial [Flammeovirgaceae bacterium]
PEKTFVGRSDKGFAFLGYHITPDEVSANQRTQDKAFETAKWRYAQGGDSSFAEYLKRWKNHIRAGLTFKINNVDDAEQIIRDKVIRHPKRHTLVWVY